MAYSVTLTAHFGTNLDKEAADKLSKTVDEACLLLAEYNGRLAAELEDRRQLARMLTEYIGSQKEALMEREKKLEARHRIHKHSSRQHAENWNKDLSVCFKVSPWLINNERSVTYICYKYNRALSFPEKKQKKHLKVFLINCPSVEKSALWW